LIWHRSLSRRLAGWLVGGLMAAAPLLPTAAFAAAPPLPAVLVATQATAGFGPAARTGGWPMGCNPRSIALPAE